MMEEEKLSQLLFVKLCSDKAAFDARLTKRVHFSMNRLKELLEAEKVHKILVYTPHIMVIRSCKGPEVTVSSDGRMLIRKVADITEAQYVAKEILQIVLNTTTSA